MKFIDKIKFNQKYMKKICLVLIVFLLLIIFIFYWYEWRPNQIRKQCSKMLESSLWGPNEVFEFRKMENEYKYNTCLKKWGLIK